MRRLLLVCALGSMGETGAIAQPAPFVASEATCQHSSGSAQSVACGSFYAVLYNADPSAPTGDEMLFNAGVAYTEGGAISAALAMFSMLRRNYPNSRLASKALARSGELYGDIAFYERAADALEEYAKKYAGEKDASDALTDAVFYRRALRDFGKALDDSRSFIKMYGAKQVAAAADAAWGIIGIYDAMDDRAGAMKSTREYLATYGKLGGDDRILIAYERIGEWMVVESCPVALVHGLCVKVARVRGKGTCGAAVVTTRVARNAGKLKEAMTAFDQAQRQFDKRGGAVGDAARAAIGRSWITAGSLEVEQTTSLPQSQIAVSGKLDSLLARIAALEDPTATVAALLLRAQVLEARANGLERGLCAKTNDAAKNPTVEALHQAAGRAYEQCVVTAMELHYPDGTMACIRGAERLLPEIHVPFRELVNREPKSGDLTVLESLR